MDKLFLLTIVLVKKNSSVLKSFDAALGITTEARVANLISDNPFELPRLDTNDFPQ